jgi:hypothetical protein
VPVHVNGKIRICLGLIASCIALDLLKEDIEAREVKSHQGQLNNCSVLIHMNWKVIVSI